jgi:hypothetical protein
MRTWHLAVSLLASQMLVSCNRAPVSVAAAPITVETAPAGAMAHGDHTPHHGGTVYMFKELHYEVVLDRHGHHLVYFSDAAREDLPASVASAVTLTVKRAALPPEILKAVIHDDGECWVADGTPVGEAAATARVDFVVDRAPYWIDVPFLTRTQ